MQTTLNPTNPEPHKYTNVLLTTMFVTFGLVFLGQAIVGPKFSTQPERSKAAEGDIPKENSVTATDSMAGSMTRVNSAGLTKAGFVVIHADENGKPGAILGSSLLLPAGTHENVEIALSRPSNDQEPLYAMLHEDNGDGTFDPTRDPALTDTAGGFPIMMKYVIGGDH